MTNRVTGKSYRVALRGTEPGVSYCSCPDFRTNTLGTRKHVLHVLKKVKRSFSSQQLKKPYPRKRLALHLRFDGDVTLRLATPDRLDVEAAKIVKPLQDRPIEDLHDLLTRLAKLQRLGHDVTVYLATGMEELKSRLEVLLGAKPEALIDDSVKQASHAATRELSVEHRQRVAAARGELLGAAFKFLGELVAQQAPSTELPPALVANLRQGLGACVEEDPTGKPRLTITLPDRSALENLAQTLAKLLAVGEAPQP